MICRQCGARNPAGLFRCRKCGEPLPVEPAPENYDSSQAESEYEYEPEYEDIESVRPDEDPREKASSPDEYFISDLYGETEPYYAKPKSKKRTKKREEESEYFPVTYPGNAQTGEYRGDRGYERYDYPDREPAVKRKSRLPFILVSFLTALISISCFTLPFQLWVSYRYEVLGNVVSEGRLTLFELAKRFFENDSLVPLVTGNDDNFGIESLVPESVNGQYAQGRMILLIIACVFVLALLLYVFFIFAVLFRSRGAAATLGILASLIYGSCTVGVMYAVKTVNDIVVEYDSYAWNFVQFKILTAPYAALGVSALIAVLCVVFAVLGIGTSKRR